MEPPFQTHEEITIKMLGAFCGLKGDITKQDGTKLPLEGFYAGHILSEMKDPSIKIPHLEESDRQEFKEAFDLASSKPVSEKTVARIQNGETTIIPLEFMREDGGHAVSLIFYKDHFAICNRGLRLAPETVKLYKYDPAQLNLQMLQRLLVHQQGGTNLAERLHIHLYEIFPKALGAIEEKGTIQSPLLGGLQVVAAKNQSVGNCTKASAMTAFKVGVYLKALEKIPPDDPHRFRKAAAYAKKASAAFSFVLRTKAIDNAKKFALSLPRDSTTRIQILARCDEATRKLGKGVLGKVISDIEFRQMYEAVRDTADDTIRKRPRPDADPLLLFIAAQRKDLGPDWKPQFLQQCPFDKETCRAHIETPITITELDERLYQAIQAKMSTYQIIT